MQIHITVPDEFVELAAKAGLDTEHYVERLLGTIAASQSLSGGAQTKLHEELLADWNHFQQTGLHLTSDEIDAWLEDLTVNPSAELPALHN